MVTRIEKNPKFTVGSCGNTSLHSLAYSLQLLFRRILDVPLLYSIVSRQQNLPSSLFLKGTENGWN